ncbi:MAG: hypothetical protein EPN25_03555 [Nitrospirae bacterium]|nr:MAG: hypothetical protein EPN25_03555 [Nitrospirota bacterium]
MTSKHYGLISLVILSALSLINCGGGGGAPGSTGSQDTGIQITAVQATTTSADIDTFCASGESGQKKQDISMNITTVNLTPEITTAHFPASLEECTITYLKANEDPAAPIIENLTVFPNCILNSGTNSCPNITLIDIARKNQYAIPVFINGTNSPAEYPTHYVAKYNCKYVNNFGKEGFFQTELDIWLADFAGCN